ncbi:uncharacterized protein EV154DRAFT_469950, partial [Mucor mucedo]|uniref:uncharacterized protein n=1 Tax=Mucor mucedo TaxID=29922 RepID=UPI002220A5C0
CRAGKGHFLFFFYFFYLFLQTIQRLDGKQHIQLYRYCSYWKLCKRIRRCLLRKKAIIHFLIS